jgi:hypothetical protein
MLELGDGGRREPPEKTCARLGCQRDADWIPCLVLHMPSGKRSLVRMTELALCGPHANDTKPEHLVTDEGWPELAALFADDDRPIRERCEVIIERRA